MKRFTNELRSGMVTSLNGLDAVVLDVAHKGTYSMVRLEFPSIQLRRSVPASQFVQWTVATGLAKGYETTNRDSGDRVVAGIVAKLHGGDDDRYPDDANVREYTEHQREESKKFLDSLARED